MVGDRPPSTTLSFELSITLAQQTVRRVGRSDSSSVVTMLALIGGMIVLVLIAGFVLVKLRKRSTQDESQGQGLLLDDLRKLKASGRLSEHEFESLKRTMTENTKAKIGVTKSSTERGALPSDRPRARPGETQVRDNERRARPGFDLTGDPLPKTPPD